MPRPQSDNLSVPVVFKKTGFFGKVALILATWFGSGLSPVTPGTTGTLAGIPLILIVGCLGPRVSAVSLAVLIAVSIWASHRTEALLGRKDPGEVVIDEVAGFLVTMFLLPLSWLTVVLGFLLFRLFDVMKPWPIRQAERLNSGLGIVADDLLAGLYSHLALRIILLAIPPD